MHRFIDIAEKLLPLKHWLMSSNEALLKKIYHLPIIKTLSSNLMIRKMLSVSVLLVKTIESRIINGNTHRYYGFLCI